jgi:glycine betaine catabolism A
MAFESTLPGRYFYDPEIFAREQERLFGQMWTCVGRADALSAAGDFKTVELAGENVLIVRGRGGELRSFVNICRHRTVPLSQCGGESGRGWEPTAMTSITSSGSRQWLTAALTSGSSR